MRAFAPSLALALVVAACAAPPPAANHESDARLTTPLIDATFPIVVYEDEARVADGTLTVDGTRISLEIAGVGISVEAAGLAGDTGAPASALTDDGYEVLTARLDDVELTFVFPEGGSQYAVMGEVQPLIWPGVVAAAGIFVTLSESGWGCSLAGWFTCKDQGGVEHMDWNGGDDKECTFECNGERSASPSSTTSCGGASATDAG